MTRAVGGGRRLLAGADPRILVRSTAPVVRVGLLLLSLLLSVAPGSDRVTTLFAGAVLLVAAVPLLLPRHPRSGWLLLLAEALLAGSGVAVTGQATSPLLVCLPATALAAGGTTGSTGVLLVTGVQAAALLAGRLAHAGDRLRAQGLTRAAAEWVVTALAVGLLSARSAAAPAADGPEDRYVEAYRLLRQLRGVTRSLPGSLDPGSVAETLLAGCVELSGCEHGAVLLHSGGDQLVPLALHGYRRVPWRAGLDQDGPLQRSWLSGEPVVDHRPADPEGGRRGSDLLVLPIRVDGVGIGLVVLESRQVGHFAASGHAALQAVVARSALPLETAALFDELRIAAAAEERTRLAREMHDGIAQDLAFLGYELDALAGRLRGEPAQDQVKALRRRITELIGELRLSISDLRSSTSPFRGVGAVLSEYARSMGTSSGLTVHLSLTEGSTRLPADTEVQLLRIAHEAMTRARRRPAVANLWVTLLVDPPYAALTIEDDGGPDTSEDQDPTATQIMNERATRLGAALLSRRRVPKGVSVTVTVGGAPHEHDGPAGR